VRDALTIARRFGDTDLETLAAAAEGLLLVSEGAVEDGLRRLDAATTAAIGGDMREITAVGHTCCFLIHACAEVRDYDRALLWSERITSFCERWQVRPLFSTCRTYYASALMWQGGWDAAERELKSAIDVAGPRTYMAIAATVRLGELRRRQGRTDEALRLWEPHDTHPIALFGRAQVAFERGEFEAALGLADRVLRRLTPTQPLDRAAALLLRLRAVVRLGRPDEADVALGQLNEISRTVSTPAMEATRRHAEGLVALAQGRLQDGRVALEDVLDLLTTANVPYESALVRLEYAEVLHAMGAQEASAELDRAVTALTSLGARHDADRGRQLAKAWSAPAATAARGASTLTRREQDVLRLLARGLSDRQAAKRLGLSEHTIHRHVANILTKLDLRTRTAAVAYAMRHGLL
jgi:ATP/maltotriose-dependent transcriptional regulator MalT